MAPPLYRKILLIMRLTTVIIIASLMQVSAATFGQRITIYQREAPLMLVLQEIRQQSGYDILSDTKAVLKGQKVSVSLKDAEIHEALNSALKGLNLTYEIKDKIITIKRKEAPSFLDNIIARFAAIDVRGKVVSSETGQALAGATIKVKGASKSVNTDAEGNFFLRDVEEKATIVISYLGFQTVELPAEKEMGMVKMEMGSNELEEVMINTGYQQISGKGQLATGSYTVIDNKKLNEQVGTNILQRLDGVTSGLTFNVGKTRNYPDKTSISIRGLSTINGQLDPLIVLDNFVYEGNIENINPNDVENITILKDAVATSIYGARGGNGVIVITTKKGAFNQKPKIEFNSNVILSPKPDLSNFYHLSSTDAVDLEEYLFQQDYRVGDTADYFRVGMTPVYELLLKRKNGLISAADSAAGMDAFKTVNMADEYGKHFYRGAVTQQYALNIRGGSDNMNWMVSGAYDKGVSELAAENDKINLRVLNEYQPLKNLKLSLGVNYTNSKATSGRPAFNTIKIGDRVVPYLKFADELGRALPVARYYRQPYIDTVGGGKLLDWNYYPLEEYKHTRSVLKTEDIVANLGLNYRLFQGLDIDLKYQYQRQNSDTWNENDIESFITRNQINRVSQINNVTGGVTYGIPLGSYLYTNEIQLKSQNFRMQLNLNKEWGDHALNGIAGFETREIVVNGNTNHRYGYNRKPLTVGAVDYVTNYPDLITGGVINMAVRPNFLETTNRFVSQYGNLNYTYRSKYTASITGRTDGSNILGASTNDKWKPLWSAGLSWNLFKEEFFKINIFDALRLKATYGYSGNVDLRKSAVPVSTAFNDYTTGLPAQTIDDLNDPQLRWEQVRQFSLGMEFALKKNVLSGSLEYYHKRSTDLLGFTPYDYTTWGTFHMITKNVASIQSKGIDLILNSKNIDRVLKWNTGFLLNLNRDKTLEYFTPDAGRLSNTVTDGASVIPVIGKPLYAIAAYKWGGLDEQGRPQGYLNGEKSLNYYAIVLEAATKGAEGPLKYFGSAVPTVSGGFNNSFSYKSVSLSINMTYRLGYYFRKNTYSDEGLINYGVGNADFSKRWKKPGDELTTNIPVFEYPISDYYREYIYPFSEIHVLKGDHVRLQYINLSYSLSKLSLRKLPVQNVQIYANASNVGIIWRANKEKLDPDYDGVLHPPKTFALGLRVNL